MKLKKVTAACLAAAMAVSMTACGGNSGTSSAAADTAGSSSTGSEDLYTVRWVTPGNEPKELPMVEEAINKKLIEDGVGVQLDIVRIPWDAWDQKTNLMFTTGEKFDLIQVMQDLKPAGTLLSRDYVLPLNDYLDEFPDLKNNFDEQMWQEVSLNGQIGAVPAPWKVFLPDGRWAIRQDILDKLNLPVPTNKDELLDTLVAMKADIEASTGQKAYFSTQNVQYPAYWLHRTYDTYPFYVDKSTNLFKINQDGTVESWFESDEFKQDAEYFRKMYENGLIDPDLLSQNNWQEAQNKGTVLFGDCFNDGTENSLRTVAGIADAKMGYYWFNEDTVKLVPMTIGNANAIPKTCENPEAVLKFLNWIYSDRENMALLIDGIEGVHYEKVDGTENRIVRLKDDSDQTKYHFENWQIADYKIENYDDTVSDATVAEQTTPLEDGTFTYSPVAGFVFDESNVVTEMSNLRNEIVASMYPIKFGMVDYDEGYDAAIAKMKAAGLDKVIAEYQRQLSEYLGK